MSKYCLLILLASVFFFRVTAEESEQTVFLGERLQGDGKTRLILDLSTILQKQKTGDEVLLNIFSKSGGNPDSVEDTNVAIPLKLLHDVLPASLLKPQKRFSVVLNSIVFEATAQQFLAVKSEVAPEMNIHLQLKPTAEISLPAYQEGDFLIASTQRLSDPVVFSKAEVKDPAALDSVKTYFQKAKSAEEENLKKLSKKQKLTEEEKELLSYYDDLPKDSGESIFLISPNKAEYFYVSHMCTEGRGFSGLSRYYPANKTVETIVPVEFSLYCPSHAADSNIVEVDVNQDGVNEIFFRVTYFEGMNLQGLQKDPKADRYHLLVETAYAGV